MGTDCSHEERSAYCYYRRTCHEIKGGTGHFPGPVGAFLPVVDSYRVAVLVGVRLMVFLSVCLSVCVPGGFQTDLAEIRSD